MSAYAIKFARFMCFIAGCIVAYIIELAIGNSFIKLDSVPIIGQIFTLETLSGQFFLVLAFPFFCGLVTFWISNKFEMATTDERL